MASLQIPLSSSPSKLTRYKFYKIVLDVFFFFLIKKIVKVAMPQEGCNFFFPSYYQFLESVEVVTCKHLRVHLNIQCTDLCELFELKIWIVYLKVINNSSLQKKKKKKVIKNSYLRKLQIWRCHVKEKRLIKIGDINSAKKDRRYQI